METIRLFQAALENLPFPLLQTVKAYVGAPPPEFLPEFLYFKGGSDVLDEGP